MRHSKRIKKLGRTKSHRKSLLRNELGQLFTYGKIKTTLAKAKELRKYADALITRVKRGTLSSLRSTRLYLNKELTNRLIKELLPSFQDRASGYTRITKLGTRRGDGAKTAIIELIGFRSQEKHP